MPPPKRKAPSKQNNGARKRPSRQPVSTTDYSSDSSGEKDISINGDTVEQDQVVEDSPSFTIVSNTDQMTPQAKKKETELMLENEVLKKRLQLVRGQSKMKRLINEEDELVMLRLRRYVKEQLWKKVKFITDDDVLERALNKCADHFSIDDKERYDWKQRMSREVQQSINNRRNNCVNDLGEAFIGE